jgi:hypothetical protein
MRLARTASAAILSDVFGTLTRRVGQSWGFMAGLVLLGGIAVAYPAIAVRAEHPLAVFILPILIVAALATPRQAAVVGVLSTLVALTEGAATTHLTTVPLAARIVVIVATAVVGVAVAKVRDDRERSLREADQTGVMMDAFQRVLVPRPSPPAGILVQTRYVPGEERLLLGGDFLDALSLPDGSLGFIVGDVCGHGADAAALGAALRAGWRTIATHAFESPHTWAHVMDDAFFGHGEHDTYATVCTGRVGVDGLVQIVSCGHPWPIIVGREPTVIRPHIARPLGVRDAKFDVAVTEFELTSDTAMLIYTDGLVENRLQPGSATERHLIRYLRNHPALDLDALLAEFGSKGFSDDVAVMTITLTAGCS